MARVAIDASHGRDVIIRHEEAGLPGDAPIAALGDAPIAAFSGAVLGCLATEHFSAFGMLPGIASAFATALLCGLLLATRTSGLFAGAFFSALYGGSFVGMTPISWLGESDAGALYAALAGVSGLVFFAVARLDSRSFAPIGIECGGRLGTIAIMASFLFIELVRPLGIDTSHFHTVTTGAFDVGPWSALRGFLLCLAGIVATLFLLRQRRIAAGGVPLRIFIASATAFVGLLVLQFGNSDDLAAMDAFYAGCFLGMSTPDRLKGWFQAIAGAVAVMVLLVPVRGFLNGFGGGLGLAAFAAAFLLIAVGRATAWMLHDILTGSGRLTTAMMSATIAVMIGVITAEPLTEDLPIQVATPASEPAAEAPDGASVLLAVGKPAASTADNPIPVDVSLFNAAADDVVLLSGVPSGSPLTNGRPSAAGGWQLQPPEPADAAIHPTPGYVGGADIAAALRNVDPSLIDRQELHLGWAASALQATMETARPAAAAPPANAVTAHDAALFRAFVQSRGPAPADGRGTARRPRAPDVGLAARAPLLRSQAAISPPHVAEPAPAAGAVRPRQPMVRRADATERPSKPAPKSTPPAPRQDRPIAVTP